MFKLTIRTPEENIFSGETDSISFATEEGMIQIFENHASFTATIAFTPIEIEEKNKETQYIARNGIFTFDNDKNEGTMLLAVCQKRSEIDHFTAKEYLEFLEKQLEEGKDLSEFQILYLENEKVAIVQQIEEINE